MTLSLFSASAFTYRHPRHFPSHPPFENRLLLARQKIRNLTLRSSVSDHDAPNGRAEASPLIHSPTITYRDITENRCLLDQLKEILLHISESEQSNASVLSSCHRSYLVGARNMIHYLSMKQFLDVEQIEEDADSIGLLNLHTISLHILASLSISIRVLTSVRSDSSKGNVSILPIHEMRKNAFLNRERLFGPLPYGNTTHIMVTVGEEAVENETLVPELLNRGATVFRINCAHGNPSIWSTVIENVRRSSLALEKPCQVLMDLAGPKLRTGLPVSEPSIRLQTGDVLVISRDNPGSPSTSRTICSLYTITCASSYLFDSVKPGDSIAFNDGKIRGVVLEVGESEITVSITQASPKGTELGKDKSINIPDSDIRFKGLTSKDLADLDFVASQANMVGVSFVRDVQDIESVRRELRHRRLDNLGIVLKIETRSSVENLPQMLLEAMKCGNPIGVMIARGDLAVECGWEELADLQEEILAVCNAAHVPVIWATQVLDSLVKSGVPSRAEITDAACGRRASCVMLNRGPNIAEAVSTLDAILHSGSSKTKAELKPFRPILFF